MSEIRAVLLDLYDTLAWTEWPRLRELLQGRIGLSERELLVALDATRPARSIGTFGSSEGDLRAVLEAAGIEAEEERVQELVELEGAFLEDSVHVWDDVGPTLAELRDGGLRTAIVSNCDHNTGPIVERLGLRDAVDATILSFEAGVAKPEPGIYRAALDALGGVPPDAAAFVDDQARYCDGARALGIRTAVLQRPDAAPPEGWGEPGGHRVIRDLRGLRHVLELGP